MSYSLDAELVASIKSFVELLQQHPSMLESPDLDFFREYLTSLGAKLPKGGGSDGGSPKRQGAGDSVPPKPTSTPSADSTTVGEDSDEPYPTIEDDGVIEADPADPNQDMGDPDASVSDEDMDKSNELKREAVDLFGQQKFEDSIGKYTEAIKLNPGSALLHAKRGQAYIRLQKPNACIRDCNRALQINPDSAVAYKFRGRAHRLLGHWEQAAIDLRQACKIDFDEQADEWLKEVTPHARKIEEWRLRKKRRDDEREIRLRKQRAEERAKAHAEAKSQPPPPSGGDPFSNATSGGGGGGGGGAGGFPGGMGGLGGIPGLDKLLEDPEVVELFSDPEVATIFAEVSQNPANLLKHQGNPKVAKLMAILQKKMGGMGGGGGGMPGMGGGMGGMGGLGGMGGMGGGMPGGFGGMPGGFGGFGGMGGFGGGGAPGGGSSGSDAPPSAPKSNADDLD